MIIDYENELSSAQAVTSTGDTASTHHYDQGAAGDAYGEELYLNVQVNETVTSAGAATLRVRLETDDNSGFSSATVLYETAALPKADLVAGAQVSQVRLPKGAERYLRVVYEVGTAALTAGKFDAVLVRNIQTNR